MFQPGQSGNLSGRPKGSEGKRKVAVRDFFKNFLEENFEQIKRDFEEVKPRERLVFIADILPYILPKLHNIDLDAEITEKKIIINFGGNGASTGIVHSPTESKELSETNN